MKKYVIFLDVDGTIIDIDGNIPPSASEAIAKAQENGHICVVNTGRPFANVVDSVKALGVKGFICACGQYISIDGNVVQNESFSVADSQAMIKKAKECRMDLFIESEHGLNYSFVHPMHPRMNEEFDRFRARGFDVDAPVETDSFYFSKFCAWEYPDSDVEEFMRFTAPYLYPIRKEGRMYEMVKNGCSKAKGMERFIELCNLGDYETLAVGDSGNDREMLSSVQHSVAMGNAPESLKAEVEFVTDTLENDGLFKAFKHYGLI